MGVQITIRDIVESVSDELALRAARNRHLNPGLKMFNDARQFLEHVFPGMSFL